MEVALSFAICFVGLSWGSLIPTYPSLTPRQADSIVSSSAFLRRGHHASAVLDGFVYIDGGEFSYIAGGETVWQYSDTLISISLAQDWTNKTVRMNSVPKPSGVPNLVSGGLWVDHVNKTLYTGFCGIASSFGDKPLVPNGLWQYSPGSEGNGGTWKNLNDTASVSFQNEIRPNGCLVASGEGFGYSLGGGLVGGYTQNDDYNISGLISYDYATGDMTHTTVVGESTGGVVQNGGLVFVPNFGPAGVMVSIGGDQLGKITKGTDDLVSMNTVQVFDPATGNWYEQAVTGSIPEMRKDFCVAGVASDNQTFEIFLYGGWAGQYGSAALPYDSAYVLTLPGFNWVKADYPAQSPRTGLTCEAVGGGQILTIGGLDPSHEDTNNRYLGTYVTADPMTYGLGLFDIGSMKWKDSFLANASDYTPSDEVMKFYTTHSRLSALNSTKVKALFSVQNFTGSSPKSSLLSSSSPSSSSGINKGAIIGGVVGGVGGLALIVVAALYFLIRSRRLQPTTNIAQANYDSHQHLPELETAGAGAGNLVPKTELPSNEVHELAGETNTQSD